MGFSFVVIFLLTLFFGTCVFAVGEWYQSTVNWTGAKIATYIYSQNLKRYPSVLVFLNAGI